MAVKEQYIYMHCSDYLTGLVRYISTVHTKNCLTNYRYRLYEQ